MSLVKKLMSKTFKYLYNISSSCRKNDIDLPPPPPPHLMQFRRDGFGVRRGLLICLDMDGQFIIVVVVVVVPCLCFIVIFLYMNGISMDITEIGLNIIVKMY